MRTAAVVALALLGSVDGVVQARPASAADRVPALHHLVLIVGETTSCRQITPRAATRRSSRRIRCFSSQAGP